MPFSEKILNWYALNRRNLPWRRTRDPYKIWISEIILQQTRVAQGLPYYEKFIGEFPTVRHMAAAKEEDILKLWQGLGYYSRARNMHKTAITISGEMQGRFPETYEGLMELRGVGDYTASAIASSSFDLPEPVVDGNVYRVLSRYFGIATPVNSARGIAEFKKLARKVMDPGNIREYNQAIMEFGAMQCTPAKPDCTRCPLNGDCVALAEGQVGELPVKLKKGNIRKRFFNYLVYVDPDNNTLLRKRTGKGIWQHLFEFPLLESERELNLHEVATRLPGEIDHPGEVTIIPGNRKRIVHKLSHQHLHTKFWIIKTSRKLDNGVALGELHNFPVPVLLAGFINTL